jgi:hypothetical protein
MTQQQIGMLFVHLLVAEPVPAAAVRTLPVDIVAGHAPQILMHASLADQKAATTAPAKGGFPCTTVADLQPFLTSPGRADWSGCEVVHCLSDTG